MRSYPSLFGPHIEPSPPSSTLFGPLTFPLWRKGLEASHCFKRIISSLYKALASRPFPGLENGRVGRQRGILRPLRLLGVCAGRPHLSAWRSTAGKSSPPFLDCWRLLRLFPPPPSRAHGHVCRLIVISVGHDVLDVDALDLVDGFVAKIASIFVTTRPSTRKSVRE